MTIRLYNTLTKYKDVFDPIDPTNVRMYVCGPTVYDFAHIGNARPVIVFDVLFRLLRHLYGESHVTYVRNITDIDDKINARALERRGNRDILTALRELTEDTQSVYLQDVSALGNLPPTYTPPGKWVLSGGVNKLTLAPLDSIQAGATIETVPSRQELPPVDRLMTVSQRAN